MQTLLKEQQRTAPMHNASIASEWGLFMPPSVEETPFRTVGEASLALHHAEEVIRKQEERIHFLERMALTDELTGLSNRRGFAVAFDRELARARRDASYCGILVMIDLDGFKAVNDTWGHATGDAYLRTVALTLQENVRAIDVVARLGGDEFALLLTHLEEQDGGARLARLETSFVKASPNFHERIPLRASFGSTPYAGGDVADELMRSADVRLYASKAQRKKESKNHV